MDNEEDETDPCWYNDIWNLREIALMNPEGDHRETIGLDSPEPDDRDLAESGGCLSAWARRSGSDKRPLPPKLPPGRDRAGSV